MAGSKRSRYLGIGLLAVLLVLAGVLYYLTHNPIVSTVPGGPLSASPVPIDTSAPEGDRGLQLMDQGKLQQAKAYYEQELKLTPNSPEILNGLGNVYLRLHQPGDALVYFKKAAAQAPDNPRLLQSIGAAYLGLGQEKQAAEAFRAVLKINPDSPLAYHGLGDALLRSNPAEAMKMYRKGLDLDPANASLYVGLAQVYERQGDIAQAFRMYQEAIQKQPQATIIYQQRGSFYMRRGQSRQALDDFNTILARTPHDPDALASRGQIHMDSGDLEAATADFRAALIQNPDLENAGHGLTRLYLRDEQCKPAQDILKPIVGRPHPPTWSLAAQGCIYACGGDAKRAADLLLRATVDSPERGNVTMEILDILSNFKNRQRAISALREAVGRDPKASHLQYCLGSILAANNDPAGARKAFLAICSNSPNLILGYLGLARLDLELQKNRAEARTMMAKALNTHADNPVYFEQLGFMALEMNEFDLARQSFIRARESGSGRNTTILGLANALIGLGRGAEAVKVLEEALRLSPDNLLAASLAKVKENPRRMLTGQGLPVPPAPPPQADPDADQGDETAPVPPSGPDKQLQLGYDYIQKAQFHKALAFFTQAQKANPDNEQATLGAAEANLYIYLDDAKNPARLEAADKLLNQALAQNTNLYEVLMLQSITRVLQGKPQQGMDSINRALPMLSLSDQPRGYMKQALVALRAGNREVGVDSLKKAGDAAFGLMKRKHPEHFYEAFASRMGLSILTGSPTMAQVREEFAPYLAVRGDADYEFVKELVNAYLGWNKTLGTPDSAAHQEIKARILDFLGEQPGDDLSYRILGRPFLHSLIYLGEGDAYRAKGQISPAREQYRKALGIFPGNPFTVERLKNL